VSRMSHRRESSGPPRCVTRCEGGPSLTRYILAGTPGSDKTSILSDRDEKSRCTSFEESTTDVITCTSKGSAFFQLEHVLIGYECHLSHRRVRFITGISRLRGRPHIGMSGTSSHGKGMIVGQVSRSARCRTPTGGGMTRGASGAATDVSGRTALSGAVEPANA
jgi:hypothetical protein